MQLCRSPLLSISAFGQWVMALMLKTGQSDRKQGLSFKTMPKGPKGRASKGALKSHLLHVLECRSLTFFAFYSYVTHTLPPPTPTAWHATLITNVFQAFISSSWEKLHLFFFSVSRWQGKQRRDKFEGKKLSAFITTDKLIIQKQRN